MPLMNLAGDAASTASAVCFFSCPSLLPFSSFRFAVRRESRPSTLPYRRGSCGAIWCSISKVHNYGTVDYERRPPLKWSSLYRRISMTSAGAAAVLYRWEAEQRPLSKWELCRVAKELRKFKRFKLALEVYEWMAVQGDRFAFISSDRAIRLDLIAKAHGISHAEEYFSTLPETWKDKRSYCALLNAYGQARMREKAESVIDIMKSRGYATGALPYNVMMTLYMNVGERDKVNMVINEMRTKNVSLDLCSYNIWITNCGAMEDTEQMEQVVEQLISDTTINANWTTYTTLATMYVKRGEFKKTLSCLKDVEIRMTGRNRLPFHHLLRLYATIGKTEDVYRIWNWYRSAFPNILNLGYQVMLSSLIKVQDIEGAERIYNEWLSNTASIDPRLSNILMGWYAKEGLVLKAKCLFDQLVEKGGKPKSATWEILAKAYIVKKQIAEALSCLKEAASCDGVKNWRPNPDNVANFLALCKEQNDTESAQFLVDVLKNMDCLEAEEYKSLIGIDTDAVKWV